MDKLVVNLSDFQLTHDQMSLLSKRLNFCPTLDHPNPGDLRMDLDQLHRRVRLHSFFNMDDPDPLPFKPDGNYHCLTEFEPNPNVKPTNDSIFQLMEFV